MSSSPTDPTSTTGSSTSWASPAETPAERIALVACGALAQPAAEVVARRGWPVDVHPLPPLLHNSPARIAGEVERLGTKLATRYARVVVGYADCGTYGALDAICERQGWPRLPGLHCYDVYGGAARLQAFFAEQPGTYVLTDFLVRGFHRSVEVELGLDRYPDLRDDYFGHYTRVVWLAQRPDAELRAQAAAAAERIGLPLQTYEVGDAGLERGLAGLIGEAEAVSSVAAAG